MIKIQCLDELGSRKTNQLRSQDLCKQHNTAWRFSPTGGAWEAVSALVLACLPEMKQSSLEQLCWAACCCVVSLHWTIVKRWPKEEFNDTLIQETHRYTSTHHTYIHHGKKHSSRGNQPRRDALFHGCSSVQNFSENPSLIIFSAKV